jgi:adenosine kinase
MLNISFLVDSMKKLRGGCAANIAYSLALLGERPTVMGTVGEDFREYQKWMEERGIDTSLIKVIPGEYTASCFIITDQKNNQIIGFYAGAMAKAHTLSFNETDHKAVKMAIVSPNDPGAMVNYYRECRSLGIPFIFDPGMQIPRLSPQDIVEGAKGSCFTILNSYELEMVLNRANLKEDEFLGLTGTLIVTKGAEGSVIRSGKDTYEIAPVPARQVMDPTGAGDAYRSAIIAGYLRGFDLPTMGKLASLVSTYVVETMGTSEHHFTIDELKTRFKENFGQELTL